MFDNLQTVDDTFDLDSLPDHHHHRRHQVCLMQFLSVQHLLTGLEQMAQVLMASFTVTGTVVCSFFCFSYKFDAKSSRQGNRLLFYYCFLCPKAHLVFTRLPSLLKEITSTAAAAALSFIFLLGH